MLTSRIWDQISSFRAVLNKKLCLRFHVGFTPLIWHDVSS